MKAVILTFCIALLICGVRAGTVKSGSAGVVILPQNPFKTKVTYRDIRGNVIGTYSPTKIERVIYSDTDGNVTTEMSPQSSLCTFPPPPPRVGQHGKDPFGGAGGASASGRPPPPPPAKAGQGNLGVKDPFSAHSGGASISQSVSGTQKSASVSAAKEKSGSSDAREQPGSSALASGSTSAEKPRQETE